MSEAFEVPSPHEKHVEHTTEHAHGRGDNFASRIAVMTALMATLGAMLSYQAGSTESEAAMDKNNAAIFKTEAANQWDYYQAKSMEQALHQHHRWAQAMTAIQIAISLAAITLLRRRVWPWCWVAWHGCISDKAQVKRGSWFACDDGPTINIIFDCRSDYIQEEKNETFGQLISIYCPSN